MSVDQVVRLITRLSVVTAPASFVEGSRLSEPGYAVAANAAGLAAGTRLGAPVALSVQGAIDEDALGWPRGLPNAPVCEGLAGLRSPRPSVRIIDSEAALADVIIDERRRLRSDLERAKLVVRVLESGYAFVIDNASVTYAFAALRFVGREIEVAIGAPQSGEKHPGTAALEEITVVPGVSLPAKGDLGPILRKSAQFDAEVWIISDDRLLRARRGGTSTTLRPTACCVLIAVRA